MSEYKKEIVLSVILAVIVVGSLAFVSDYFFQQTQVPKGPPGGPPPPGPPPPIYTLAEITVEATVLDVNKTFLYHYEPPSNSSMEKGTLTNWEEPLQPPSPPSPPPPPTQPNITAHDAYEIVVTLRIDSVVTYKSEIEGLLKQGDQIVMKDVWLSPHYVDGVLEEMPDLEKGDRIRVEMRLYSRYEELDLSDPSSYWWQWSYPNIEIISYGS